MNLSPSTSSYECQKTVQPIQKNLFRGIRQDTQRSFFVKQIYNANYNRHGSVHLNIITRYPSNFGTVLTKIISRVYLVQLCKLNVTSRENTALRWQISVLVARIQS